MAEIVIRGTAVLKAPPEVVYGIFADYHEGHPSVLPRPHFGRLVVERGGTGAGTRFTVEAREGLKMRTYRMDVSEPEPGRLLVEKDVDSDLVTHFRAPGRREAPPMDRRSWDRTGPRDGNPPG